MDFTYRKNINDDYNLKNLSICLDLINKKNIKKIGSGGQGEIYKVFSPKCGSAVIKIRITKVSQKVSQKLSLIEELQIEYKIMLLTNRMIKQFICPNFIITYNFNEKNKYLVMEYADGDTEILFKNTYYDENIYKSYICQVLLGLYAFNNYTMLYHRDLRPANILYKKISENIIFHYKINNKDYYVPTYGFLFMICDYGQATHIVLKNVYLTLFILIFP
jgi:serine/threonine protein kinase